jgi:hypothetical protein
MVVNMTGEVTNMGNLFDEVESELLKQSKAITPEQLAEDERRRQVQRDYEALHTAIETDEDRADPEKYPQESEDDDD